MKTVSRDGAKLAYEERGSAEHCYLFVHGWTCDHTHFAPQVEHFAAAGYRTVAVDLRGHGESDDPGGTYSIPDFADDVAHVIETLELPRPIAVGHSMGGATVLELAARHADLVSGIVMVDPAPLIPDALAQALEPLLQAMEAGDNTPRREFIVSGLFLPTDDATLREQIADLMCETDTRVAVAAMRAIFGFQGVKAAAACTVPALHIAAEPALNSQALMAEHLKGVVNAQTAGAGHFNQLLVPNQVNEMIADFTRAYVDWR